MSSRSTARPIVFPNLRDDPPVPTMFGVSEIEDLMGETLLLVHGAARRHGLTLVQVLVLRLIQAEGEVAPSGLAERLGISRPAVTSSMNILEAAGWIRRGHPAGDLRGRRVRLTPEARTLLLRLSSERRQLVQEALGELRGNERRALAAAMRHLVAAIRRRRSNGPSGGRRAA